MLSLVFETQSVFPKMKRAVYDQYLRQVMKMKRAVYDQYLRQVMKMKRAVYDQYLRQVIDLCVITWNNFSTFKH